MNALLTVLKKELTDAFRDRRMVMVAFVVMPLVFPLIFAGLGTLGAKKQTEKLESVLELPVVGAEHAPNLVAWLGENNVKVLQHKGMQRLQILMTPKYPEIAQRQS